MWSYRISAPQTLVPIEVAAPSRSDLAGDELLVRFLAGAICGSDLPKFMGIYDPDNPYIGDVGVPLHEVVGEVVATTSPRFDVGDRVVGVIARSRGLSEIIVNPASFMTKVDDRLDDLAATVVQPLATVLNALAVCPDVTGRRVAVIGLGPLGMLFAHVMKSSGAAKVIGVDRVDREAFAGDFGVDELVRDESRNWAAGIGESDGPDLVIDAVGHQQGILDDAVTALAPDGHLFVFGLPEDSYVLPMRTFFRKRLTMNAGATLDWPRFLTLAQEYLLAHRDLVKRYFSHVFDTGQAQEAFETALRPLPTRLKVGLRNHDVDGAINER